MHSAFCIPEILDHIFAQLSNGCALGLSHRDFAALARTCKTFQEPALNFLWREQDTLVNILKSLPSHTWSMASNANLLHITGPFRPSDWDKPLAYAMRIRTLSSMLPRDHLCPNLKSIVLEFDQDSASEALFSFIHFVLSPKVTHVDMTFHTSDTHVLSLRGLPIQYSQLRQLRLKSYSYSMWDEPSYFERILSEITLALDRIEDLTLNKVDQRALEHLSQLPVLRSLRLETLVDMGPLDSRTYPFSSLRDLHLGNTPIGFVIEFLDLLSNCSLISFHTLHVDVPERQEIETPVTSTLANYVVHGLSLAALFCFANLTDIILRPPVGFDIDDAMAWDIARAWPRVKSLFLLPATDLHHPSSMSLRGFSAFAKHCPALSSFGVTFDASTVPPLDDTIVSQSSLVALDVDISPISDPDAVASFMSALFPNLARIYTHKDWEWETAEDTFFSDEAIAAYGRFTGWKKVKEILLNSRSATNGMGLSAS
ncbi:F-box domain-containing protein [Mycena sanguinolenta]|uniref:F-box domain-containing protein n=1 Tax=Mycena sanguinolenta TaxID=230812 RepID=A0A8H6ZCN6_9AGAR|nr:F-box domain-containing protein [Mycena sanguinolenta]